MHPEGDLIQVYESRVSIWSPLKKKVENPKNDETLSYSIAQKLHQNFGCKQTKRQTKRKAVKWVKPAIRNPEKDHGHPLYSFHFFPPLLFLFLSLFQDLSYLIIYIIFYFSLTTIQYWTKTTKQSAPFFFPNSQWGCWGK